MPPRLSWSHLVPGLVAIALLVAVTLGVMFYSGVGKIRGDTVRLHVVARQARGVMPGTEVWLSGQKIGAVEEIGFRPPSASDSARVLLTVKVRENDAHFLRLDSPVEIRTGGTLVGPVVVYLGPGTPGSARVSEDDTLRALAPSDLAAITDRLDEITESFGPTMADAKLAMASVRGDGTIGALLRARHDGGGDALGTSELRANVTRLRAAIGGNRRSGNLMLHARGALARVDSIRALLQSPNTTLGRMRRDSTLFATIGGVLGELDSLVTALDSAGGNLGRFQRDSALVNAIANARREMSLLFEDARKRPLRYLHLF